MKKLIMWDSKTQYGRISPSSYPSLEHAFSLDNFFNHINYIFNILQSHPRIHGQGNFAFE